MRATANKYSYVLQNFETRQSITYNTVTKHNPFEFERRKNTELFDKGARFTTVTIMYFTEITKFQYDTEIKRIGGDI